MAYTPRKTAFNVVPRKSAAGLGIFTNVAIPKRRFIIEYWGDIVSDDEANRIGGKYLFELGHGKTINGTTRKNIARYINHSCRPNCEVEVKGRKVLVFSKRAIKPGEELSYNYGKDYFTHFIGKHCRCAKHDTRG